VVVFDCLQRVVPAIHSDSAWAAQLHGMVPFVRAASLVLVTTPVTGGDVHSFFGVPRARIRLAPMCFSPPPAFPTSGTPGAQSYLVWVANRSTHKNHAVILEGLRRYYEDHGGRLRTVIVGTETGYLREDRTHPVPVAEAYLHRIRTMLAETEALHRHVTIAGEVSDSVYSATLAGARLLLHSSLYDNGTFAAFDAAWFGVPTLSARYPAMQYLDQQFGLSLSWFDSRDPASVAAGIDRLDREGPPGPLPSQARLEQQHWPHRAAEFRQALEPWLTTPA
jgi:glycosyltransferase involved in cell wall biosynthesis